ncbi:MAG: GNAT family N-acetyltransferase [Pseudothermotoga sp.]|nr:GNAT family N-acetyltransferase [Pseudothermotoga sp.]
MNIVKLNKKEWESFKLEYHWETFDIYRVEVAEDEDGWVVKVKRSKNDERVVKTFREYLYRPWMEDCEIYGLELDGKIVGWMTLSYEHWCNRLRIFELFILEEYRNRGFGSMLLNKAKEIAKEKKFRAIVLDTHNSNFKAIEFYRKHGFELNGFDITQYHNDDVDRNEVRIDLVFKIQ